MRERSARTRARETMKQRVALHGEKEREREHDEVPLAVEGRTQARCDWGEGSE